MNDILHEQLDKCAILFINDTLIYSQIREEHDEHLQIVLGKLGNHQLLLAE